jgi:hypothetical protein
MDPVTIYGIGIVVAHNLGEPIEAPPGQRPNARVA